MSAPLPDETLRAAIDEFLATTTAKEIMYRRRRAIEARVETVAAAPATSMDPETREIAETYRRLGSVDAVFKELDGAFSRYIITARLKAAGYTFKRGRPYS